MTDTKWINETAARYGKGGDPSIHKLMQVAIDHERDRCASIALAIDSNRGNEKEIARAIRAQAA